MISLHDVAPSTIEATAAWRTAVAELTDEPVSLLAVARYRGRDSWRSGPARSWVCGQGELGDEVVLHGYSHLDRAGRDGRELAGRGPAAIVSLIGTGLAELRAAGFACEGFIAPAYAHPAITDACCRAAGLSWWATRRVLRADGWALRLPSIGLGASTATRRALSPLATRAAARLLSRAPVVRLDLHPADLRHPHLERAGRELLELLLDQGRRPVTHGGLRPGCAGAACAHRQRPAGGGGAARRSEADRDLHVAAAVRQLGEGK